MGLDLYALIEPMLGFEEEKNRLYDIFLEKLSKLGIKRFLDVGCGSGSFMQKAFGRKMFCEGIDLSQEMVKRAQKKGLQASHQDICTVKKRYEAVTAVFDVINYLDQEELKRFFSCVEKVLEPGGYFLCDMNTLYGFEEVAQGALMIDQDDRFIGIEAEFEKDRLTTNIVTFFKQRDCYKKEKDTIVQYYHDVEYLKGLGLKLIDIDFISLYGEEVDKALLTFQKD